MASLAHFARAGRRIAAAAAAAATAAGASAAPKHRYSGARGNLRWPSTTSAARPATTAAAPLPQAKKPPHARLPAAVALSLLAFALGFTMAAAPAAPTLKHLVSPPSDQESLALYTPSTDKAAAIERSILDHPLTRALMQDPKYIASRPHMKIPAQLRAQNLTAGTLLGTGKIEVPPLQFATEDGSTFVSLQYLGESLCGHPNIIHGGLLATLLDEGLARCCFPALPNRAAVTASLKVDYKAPAMAGQVLVLRAETTKVEGRKAWVKGHLETLVDESKGEKPVVVTEAEALFIEPKMAKTMNLVKG